MFVKRYTRTRLESENVQRQPAKSIQKDLFKGIIPWGVNNAFPLLWAKLVQESPVAIACISTWSDFLEGNGFTDPSIEKIKVSENTTFGDLHSRICPTYSLFRGGSINVKYNKGFAISQLYLSPFENCRLGFPDSSGWIQEIKYNPFYGFLTPIFVMNDTVTYDSFNPDKKVVAQQIAKQGSKYKGQMLFFGETSPLNRFYPQHEAWSAKDWMSLDKLVPEFHSNNLKNGLFQSVLLKMIGDPNLPSQHPDDQQFNETTQQMEPKPGTNMGTRLNEEMQAFTGSENAGDIFVLWSSLKEAMPSLEAFPTTSNDNLFTTLDTLITNKITTATKVPGILSNVASGATLGGDGNIMRAAVKLMQQRVLKHQNCLERIYTSILANLDTPFTGEVKIKPYNPFPELDQVKIDPLGWAALTRVEQRTWLKDNTDFPILDVNAVATPAPVTPTKPVSNFANALHPGYPEGAKSSALRAMKFKNDKNPACGTKSGWQRCEDISKGMPLPYKHCKRIYNYLYKNQEHESKPFSESCEALLFHAWGGKDMMNWASDLIKNVES